jgi:NhaP-type Na+/H+ and K+/H+ antiporter
LVGGVVLRFFIGALALAVICVLFGLPVAVVLGWVPVTATERKMASSSDRGSAPSVPN